QYVKDPDKQVVARIFLDLQLVQR
nr:RecName: Full=48 kDa cell wall protein [Nicotiana tabacum]